MPDTRTNHQLLVDLIDLADRVMARQWQALDLVDDVKATLAEILRRATMPADDIRVIGDAEVALGMALHHLAEGDGGGVHRRWCWLEAAQSLLVIVRDDLFAAFEQAQRPTP